MSEFNGKKYYGYSLHNDPTLLTTTRNFEFQYTRPEKLERVIQKVQLSDGADNKHKKTLLAKYCKLKKPGGDLAAPYKTRDLDVETHISRTDQIRVRNLSEDEIDQLIGKARSNVNMLSGGEKRDLINYHEPNQQQQQQQQYQQQQEQEQQQQQQQTDQQQLCEDLEVYPENEEDATKNNIIIEEYRLPKPKWVEIEETSGYAILSMADLAHPQSDTSSPSVSSLQPQMEQQKREEQQYQQQRQHQYHQHKIHVAHTQKDLGQRVQQMQLMNRAQAGEDAENAYFIEDSDYEYEMSKRLDYTKYCKKRPSLDEMTNVSNESGGIPRFIEIEEHPRIPCMNLSFLKNSKPIRYTDLTDELVEDDDHVESSISRGRDTIKGSTKVVHQNDQFITELESEKKPVKKDVLDRKDGAKRKAFPLKLTPNEPIPGVVKPPSIIPRKIIKPEINTSPTLSPKNRYKSKSPPSKTARIRNLAPIKSFEELKTEKVAIFNRMNLTQERIIEMLDKLRMNLLEVYVPESHYDRNRRQKNAMEFSVRFSRNFLYPLRGMVEDIQNTTVEQINSSSSNEACIRIASIYALMLQSLQTYQRQLRFFLLDQVPQKLTALISLIYATTNMCLERGVFDINDQIIECLLDRCSKFLGFLEDLHDDRFMTVRENYRKSTKEKKTNLHNKYDLKMFMNDLNMYEPKLVPKRPSNMRLQRKGTLVCSASSTNTTARRRIKKVKKTTVEPIPVTSSEFMVTSAAEDTIATQIQKVDCEASSDLLSSIYNLTKSQDTAVEKDMGEPAGNSLNKAIIEALQIVTKQQVRQVLEPILQTLGSALDKKNNSETIETILKALNKKLFSKSGGENKKRRDTKTNRKRNKVRESGTDITSLLVNASNQLKALKHTKKFTSKKQQFSHRIAGGEIKKHSEPNTDARQVTGVDVGVDDANYDNERNDDFNSNDEWESFNEDHGVDEKRMINRSEPNAVSQQGQYQKPMKEEGQKAQILRNLRQQIKKDEEASLHLTKAKQFAGQRQNLQEQQRQQQHQQHHQQQQHPGLMLQPAQLPIRLKQKNIVQQQQQQRQQQQHQQQQQHHQQQQLEQSLLQTGLKQKHIAQQQQQQQQQQYQNQQRSQQQHISRRTQRVSGSNENELRERSKSKKDCLTQQIKQLQPPLQQNLTQLRYSRSHLKPGALNLMAPTQAIAATAGSDPVRRRPLQSQPKQHTRIGGQPPAPCLKARSLRLCKKRRNMLRSPPPVPYGTPMNSARSIQDTSIDDHASFSDVEAIEDGSTADVVVTNRNTDYNTNLFNDNCTGSRTAESAASRLSDNGTSTDDGKYVGSIAVNDQKSFDADSEISIISSTFQKITVNDTNAEGLLQNDAMMDLLTECLMRINPESNGGSKANDAPIDIAEFDNDDEDDNDDNDCDDENDNWERDNDKIERRETEVQSNERACIDLDNVSEVASYISTIREKKKINKKPLEQQQLHEQTSLERFNRISEALNRQLMEKNVLGQAELHLQLLLQQQQQHKQSLELPQQSIRSRSQLHLPHRAKQQNQQEQRPRCQTNQLDLDAKESAAHEQEKNQLEQLLQIVFDQQQQHQQRQQQEQQLQQQQPQQQQRQQQDQIKPLNSQFPDQSLLSSQSTESLIQINQLLLQQLQQQQLQHQLQQQHLNRTQFQTKPVVEQKQQQDKFDIDLLQPLEQQAQQQQQQQIQQQKQQQHYQSLNDINRPNSFDLREKPLSEIFLDSNEHKGEDSTSPQKVDLKLESMISVRDQFQNLCQKNRFYSNPTYADPWKVLSSLSNRLAMEVINKVEEDFSVGVSKFVEDFLEMEMHN